MGNASKPNPVSVVIGDVLVEREQQDRIAGEQNLSPLDWLAAITVVVGDLARIVLDLGAVQRKAYRVQLVKVAAMAVQAIECFDRAEQLLADLKATGR